MALPSSRRVRSSLLASALVVGTVIAAGSAFLPAAPAPRAGTALATVASVAAMSQPAFAEEAGFLNLGKIELGGGFAINLDIPETGVVNIAVVIAGLIYLLGPLLSESMAGREKEIQTDIDDAIKKYNEATTRLAEAEKARDQANSVIAEINASVEKDTKDFEATITASTKATLEKQAASAEAAMKSLESSAATQVESYIQQQAVARGLAELSTLDKAKQAKFMDQSIKAL